MQSLYIATTSIATWLGDLPTHHLLGGTVRPEKLCDELSQSAGEVAVNVTLPHLGMHLVPFTCLSMKAIAIGSGCSSVTQVARSSQEPTAAARSVASMYSFSRAWPWQVNVLHAVFHHIWPSAACTVLYMVPRPPKRPSQRFFWST